MMALSDRGNVPGAPACVRASRSLSQGWVRRPVSSIFSRLAIALGIYPCRVSLRGATGFLARFFGADLGTAPVLVFSGHFDGFAVQSARSADPVGSLEGS